MRADAVHRKSTLCLQHTLKTDLKKNQAWQRTEEDLWLTESPDSHNRGCTHWTQTHTDTHNHTLFSLLSLTCVFSLKTLLEIKQENESVTLLFAKGQPVHEDKNRGGKSRGERARRSQTGCTGLRCEAPGRRGLEGLRQRSDTGPWIWNIGINSIINLFGKYTSWSQHKDTFNRK